MPEHPISDPKHWLDRTKEARALADQIADDYGRLAQRAKERAAGHWATIKVACGYLAVWAPPTSAARAVLGVMHQRDRRMQLSFLFNCDDVASPALKVDPDMQIAHVVPRT